VTPAEERRRYRRLPLRVPVLFTVTTKTGTTVTRSGITENVSPGGVFFRTSSAADLDPHQSLTVKLLIPRGSDPSEATVSLSGEARLVRKERLLHISAAEGGERWGVAVQFVSRPSVDLSTVNEMFGTA